MKRVIKIALLTFISITVLSGCLVEKKDLKKIARTTDNLRVYQPGDSISHYVTAVSIPNAIGGAPVTQTGSLNINWSTPNPPLIRPGTPDPIGGAIKEVTILSLNGSETSTVRYVSQNVDGQITLHAIEDSAGERFWLNSNSDPVQGSDTKSFITFYSEPSPLGIEFGDMGPITFHVMGGCSGIDTTCENPIGIFTDQRLEVVGDSTQVSTNFGVFLNPFQIEFNGNTTPASFPLLAILDIRDACGKTGALISHGTGGAGTMYVMPEVGMIRMENTCTNSDPTGNTVHYTVSIRSANFY